MNMKSSKPVSLNPTWNSHNANNRWASCSYVRPGRDHVAEWDFLDRNARWSLRWNRSASSHRHVWWALNSESDDQVRSERVEYDEDDRSLLNCPPLSKPCLPHASWSRQSHSDRFCRSESIGISFQILNRWKSVLARTVFEPFVDLQLVRPKVSYLKKQHITEQKWSVHYLSSLQFSFSSTEEVYRRILD